MTKRLRATTTIVLAAAAAALFATPGPAPAQSLRTLRIVSGLTRPLFVTAAPRDTSRIFIVEQGSASSARIKIYKPATGLVNATPFLTIPNVATGGDEQGLLGLAFHPEYPDTPYFFVNFTRSSDGATVIRRYNVSANPDTADPATSTLIQVQSQPQANHNGGWIGFGPDGYLYAAYGDGGGANDQGTGHDPVVGNGQSDGTRLGKILRLDINNGLPFTIPPSNPFVGMGSPREEFWAKGVRNPWRPSFDRLTGDFYIADVGQNLWEEVHYQPAASTGGENYGWRKFEGYAIFNCPTPCDSSGLTRPVQVYSHGGAPFRCSITGGYVYRGMDIPDLYGRYFYSDYCSDQTWTICVVNGVATELTERTSDMLPGVGFTLDDITSYGEDARGELYITDRDGEIYAILPDLPGGPDVIAPTAAVQTPNGGEIYVSGTTIPIQWDASDAFGVVSLDILFSRNGGLSFPSTIVTGIRNGCVYPWNTAGVAATDMGRIKIIARDAAGNFVEDVSNANFTIGPVASAAPTVTLLTPNGGEVLDAQGTASITWNAMDDLGVTAVDLLYSADGGATFPTTIATNLANSGTYVWSVDDAATTMGRIRVVVRDANFQAAQDASDANFEITLDPSSIPTGPAPTALFLGSNSPEPFRDVTRVTFGVPRPTTATLDVYSTEGRAIRRLSSGPIAAGTFERSWNGRDDSGARVAAGLYFLKLATPEGDVTRRITIVR
ncbi:MAG: PQQ-dependent sugar dehydrogenase [bacterium]